MIINAEKIYLKEYLFIDLRTINEYKESHIPGAINIPILNNEDRHEVGKIYKQIGKNQAISEAILRVEPRLYKLIDKIKRLSKENRILLYCQRGGMRSSTIYSILNKVSNNIFILENGYKAYRNYILKDIKNKISEKDFFVLQGYTGSGKTLLLKEIEKNGYDIIDLENLANHHGSVFGSIPEINIQPSQKQFQNNLYKELFYKGDKIFIEAESTKIGKIFLPDELKKKIDNSKQILIDASIDFRVDILTKVYAEAIISKKEEIYHSLNGIKRFISKKVYLSILECIYKNDLRTAIYNIVKYYYDPIYERTINRKNIKFYKKIKIQNIEKDSLKIIEMIK